MEKQAIALLIFTTVFLSSASSFAGSRHDGKGPFMALFDTNTDGVVTMDEFKQAAAERFGKMDVDSSGAVSKEEFRNYIKDKRQKRYERKFVKMDTDKDGNISQTEYLDYKQKRAQSKFQRMDKNEDGLVSTEEFKNNRRYGKWSGRHGKGGIFAKLDKNSDGTITRDESMTAWSEWFAKIDGNGDEVVTTDEVRTYRENKIHNRK